MDCKVGWVCVLSTLFWAGCGGDSENDEASPDDEHRACTIEAPAALRTCVSEFSAAIEACFATSGRPCTDGDLLQAEALDELQFAIEDSCEDGDLAGLGVQAAVGRLRNACASEARSLSWRTFGGPQAAAWEAAGPSERACLTATHRAASTMIDRSLAAIDECLDFEDFCEPAFTVGKRNAAATEARGIIESACSDLRGLIAIDATTYVDRVAHQVDCLAATGHDDPAPLSLSCGPDNAQFDAPRGQWTKVVVDSDTWGTTCADGSPYAFHVQLAPPGQRLDRILIALQGGGVCLFADDCADRMESSPGLFTAMDDEPIGDGIASDSPSVSPFANWTRVYLPYCTQDVFAGGGVEEDLGSGIVIPRYGSVNLRAAVRMVRDVVWKLMDAERGTGFRPDQVVALFGGFSAGGYGTLYNYHWFLDDLQWPRTAAFPDAGMALDNGEVLGVSGLGLVKIPVWGSANQLPPYCFEGDCAVGSVLYEAISPRLKRVPEQQMLIVSNPFDLTQQGDAFFPDTPSFINEMRRSYCATKDLPGINYFITSESDVSVHVVSVRNEMWNSTVDGVTMKDWFSRAVTDPDSITDRAEEADFVDKFPGVMPYPCNVPL